MHKPTNNNINDAIGDALKEGYNIASDDFRRSRIQICFGNIITTLGHHKILHTSNKSNKEVVKMIKTLAKDNHIKLNKIPVNYFGKDNAKKALKIYDGMDLEKYDENINLLKSIEKYIIENGTLNKKK